MSEELELAQRENKLSGPSKVVVAIDTQDLEDVVIVGINAVDRPGLLLDISRGLHSLGLQLHTLKLLLSFVDQFLSGGAH